MIFSPENRDDIIRYYRNTYVKFKEHGDTLFHIQYVEHNKVTGTVEDGRPFTLYLSEDHPYEVDYVLPHKSFFQYKGHAMLLERIPAKQYYRGLREDNTRVSFLTAQIQQADLSFELLKAYVAKQQFYTLDQASGNDCAGKASCVLTPRMMFHRKSRNIHIDFIPVAAVQRTGRIITMLQPVFLDEVQSYIKETGEQWSIK